MPDSGYRHDRACSGAQRPHGPGTRIPGHGLVGWRAYTEVSPCVECRRTELGITPIEPVRGLTGRARHHGATILDFQQRNPG